MPWFKVDDTLTFHTKVVAAGNPAMGLWVRAGAWSAQQLTDGVIPDHIATTLGKPAEIRRLVDVGLWDAVDGGYVFHGWNEPGRQPTRQQVEAERAAAAERQRRARDRAAQSRNGITQPSRRDRRNDTGVSNGPPVPSRPDPTQTPVLTLVCRRLSGGTRSTTTDTEVDLWQEIAGPDTDLEAEAKAWLMRNADVDLENPGAAWLGWLRKASQRNGSAPRRSACPDPECQDGWLGEDTAGRPKPCPRCRNVVPLRLESAAS